MGGVGERPSDKGLFADRRRTKAADRAARELGAFRARPRVDPGSRALGTRGVAMITRALLWLRSVLLRRRLEREMQAEMAEHLARSTERLVARGLSPEAARREANREFGNVPYLQEEARIARGTHGLDTLL